MGWQVRADLTWTCEPHGLSGPPLRSKLRRLTFRDGFIGVEKRAGEGGPGGAFGVVVALAGERGGIEFVFLKTGALDLQKLREQRALVVVRRAGEAPMSTGPPSQTRW